MKQHWSYFGAAVGVLVLISLLSIFESTVDPDLFLLGMISFGMLLLFFFLLVLFWKHHEPHRQTAPRAYDHSAIHAVASGLEHEPKHLNIHERSRMKKISHMNEEHAIRHMVNGIQHYLQSKYTYEEIRKIFRKEGINQQLIDEAHRRYKFFYHLTQKPVKRRPTPRLGKPVHQRKPAKS